MNIRSFVLSPLIALCAAPALAQDIQGRDVLINVGADIWRASKISGTRILGPGHERIGAVKDLLVGSDGRIKYVVVGVGGFLGVGQKAVAIPFSQVKFTDQPAAEQGETPPIPNTAEAAGSVGPAQSNNLGTDVTGSIAPRRDRDVTAPDHGTIELTRDQLRAAPDFQAPSH